MKVIALTFGDATMASTQYRLVQFQDALRREEIVLTVFPASTFRDWRSLRDYDLVVVQKRLLRTSLVKRIRKESRCLIYDTDDAVWEPHGRTHSWWTRWRTQRRLRAITGLADLCTVANEHLARALQPMSRRVEIVPMALDGSLWSPRDERSPGPIRLGWAGAPPNLVYLAGISQALREVQASRPDVEVVVYSGKVPSWEVPVKSRHIPYAPATEAGVVRDFDIGLLPLPNDNFAAGKSPIKALQYAACGLPCVASPVGATNEIVRPGETGLSARTSDEWRDALIDLIDNEEKRLQMGRRARDFFMEHHDYSRVARRLAAVWRAVTCAADDRS